MSTQTAIRRSYVLDHQVAELLATIVADPFAAMRVGIEAPGGYGKTVVLAELARVYREAGIEVLGADEALDGSPAGGAAILLDDAHRLSEARLERLRLLAGTPGVRLAVAYRPWPRPPALARLAAVLRRHRPVLLLAPLTVTQVDEYLDVSRAGGSDQPRPPAVAEALRAQTGGVPRYVERLAGAGTDELTGPVLVQFRYELDRLDIDSQLFLLAAEAGVGAHLDLLGSLLRRGPEEVAEVVEAVRAAGLLGDDGELVPVARRAVAALFAVDRRVAVRRRLVELQRERGASVLGLARSLLGTGITGPDAAAAFVAAAEEALPEEPALSAALFEAGSAAGRPVRVLAARWARAAALAGDLGSALRLADEVIAGPERPDRVDCALVAAAALAHRGQLARSAELYQWSGTGPAAAFATVGQIGTGQIAGGEALARSAGGEALARSAGADVWAGSPHPAGGSRPADPAAGAPPTLLGGAAQLMARGVHESLGGAPAAALSSLVRASDLLEPAGPGVLLPDSPAALAALVGLHCGDLDTARAVLDRALAARLGGAVMAPRHQLLQAWILLVRGETALARHWLPANRDALEPRDRLFALALEVGLARRDSDLPALRQAWAAAGEAVLRHPVDLFTLLPLGELMVAAARLGEYAGIAAQVTEGRALLARLGDPPLWSAPLRWSGLHAAIIANQRAEAEAHAEALAAGAGCSRYATAVSVAAGSWLALLRGQVDPGRVSSAARGLHDVGLRWDAARLAGQAAIRTSDRAAMVALLDCARLLQGRPAGQRGTDRVPADSTSLSDRERQVADLVLAGLTYRQIGDRLFISPKTVEHHVARMRQRLGCGSRGELLTTLRSLRRRRSDHVAVRSAAGRDGPSAVTDGISAPRSR